MSQGVDANRSRHPLVVNALDYYSFRNIVVTLKSLKVSLFPLPVVEDVSQ